MSNVIVRTLLLVGILIALVGLPGCGGSPITITLSCSGCTGSPNTAATINQGDTLAITANVTNDKTNSGVSWSIGTSSGSLSSQTTTSVTYVAPAALTSTTTATVTATSIANTNVTESLTITIDAIFQFESTSLPVATVGLAYAGTISTVGASGPFTWAIVSGSLPTGLTLSSSDTASAEITGTPTEIGTSSFTIQVTNGSGNLIKETITITVNPPPGLTITTPAVLAPGTIGQSYIYALQAAYGTQPYTWTIVSGSLPSGLFMSSSGIISGTPNPPVVTTTFNVQVTDSATPNPATYPPDGRGYALTISVAEPSVNEELSGNYAFLVSGFDANGKSFTAAGSLSASGGALTNGVMDINDGGTVQTEIPFNGSYSIAANGVGTMSFVTGRTFALSFVPSANIQNANLIEFDNTGDQASGVLLEQSTTDFSAALTMGSYAFGFLGSGSTGLRYGLAGAFTVKAGIYTNSYLDSDNGGSLQSDMPFTVSDFNSPNGSGRGTMAFSVSHQAANYAFYVVNLEQVLVIEIDQAATVSGNILQQQSESFGPSSLTDGVFETTALTSGGTALSQLGVLTTDGVSTLSTSFNNNTSSSGVPQPGPGGPYMVAPTTGRTTLTGTGLAVTDPVLYLVQGNEGFLVGTDAAVTFGFMKGQPGPLTLSGTYAGGSIAPTLPGPSGEVAAAVAGSELLTLTYNASTSGGLLENQTAYTSYSSPSPSTNGRGTIPQSGSPTAIFYVLSPDEFWSLSVSASGMIQIFPPYCNPSCGTE
ncbi:MAG TPA: Ig domain-containing protein [Terriglobales bacterium]|nr:Ig domain-containing protein [Terriglobales bacterium]